VGAVCDWVERRRELAQCLVGMPGNEPRMSTESKVVKKGGGWAGEAACRWWRRWGEEGHNAGMEGGGRAWAPRRRCRGIKGVWVVRHSGGNSPGGGGGGARYVVKEVVAGSSVLAHGSSVGLNPLNAEGKMGALKSLSAREVFSVCRGEMRPNRPRGRTGVTQRVVWASSERSGEMVVPLSCSSCANRAVVLEAGRLLPAARHGRRSGGGAVVVAAAVWGGGSHQVVGRRSAPAAGPEGMAWLLSPSALPVPPCLCL